MSEIAVGVIRKVGSQFCIFFSDGRRECKDSKEAAEKRERQIQFFKNAQGATDEEDLAELDISGEYSINGTDATIYATEDENGYHLVLATGPEDDRKVYLLTPENLEDEHEEYASVVEFIASDLLAEEDDVIQMPVEDAIGGDTYRNRHWSGSPGGHNKGKFKKLKKKCAKCGKTSGMLDIHHKSGNRKNLHSGKGLQVLCRSCHRSLHQGGGNSKGVSVSAEGTLYGRSSSYSIEDMTPILLEAEQVQILNSDDIDNDAYASAGLEKQRDLLYIRFILTHEGTNKNHDHFTREELKAAASTPLLKQINWEHGEPAIGTIYKSEYKEVPFQSNASFSSADGLRGRIECEGVVWKYKYPQYAKTMINRHQSGNLTFSMETYFARARCSVCEEIFESKDSGEGSYCNHLNDRHSAEAAERASRHLLDNNFGGVGCVVNPACEGADALALAKDEQESRKEVAELSDKVYTEEDLKQAIADAIVEHQAKTESNVELETAKAEIEKLTNELSGASDTLKALQEEKDVSDKALADFKSEIESKEKLRDRMKALADVGYEIPEDESPELEELHTAVKEYSDAGFEFFKNSLAARKKLDEKDLKKMKEKEEADKKKAKAAIRVPTGTAIASENKEDDEEKPAFVRVCEGLSKV
jgi:hypothetical protein